VIKTQTKTEQTPTIAQRGHDRACLQPRDFTKSQEVIEPAHKSLRPEKMTAKDFSFGPWLHARGSLMARGCMHVVHSVSIVAKENL
jgi:hypothetical protein